MSSRINDNLYARKTLKMFYVLIVNLLIEFIKPTKKRSQVIKNQFTDILMAW